MVMAHSVGKGAGVVGPRRIKSARASRVRPRALLADRLYVAPSSRPGVSELDLILRQGTVVIPDTTRMHELESFSSQDVSLGHHAVLQTARMFQEGRLTDNLSALIEGSFNDARCLLDVENRTSCVMDQALVNLGTLLTKSVSGTVSTEINPRLAHDPDAILTQAMHLMDRYAEMGVPQERVAFKFPATWGGISAAKELEKHNLRSHLTLVFTLEQAVAAAESGASVVQPHLGRLRDFNKANRQKDRGKDRKGRRSPSSDPAMDLVKDIAAYLIASKSNTRLTVASVRSPQDVCDLAGVGAVIASPLVIRELELMPTLSGFNDEISAGTEQALSEGWVMSEARKIAKSSPEFWKKVDLSEAGVEKALKDQGVMQLLANGLSNYIASAERCERYLELIAPDVGKAHAASSG